MNEFDKIIPIELDDLNGSIAYDYVLIEYDPNLTKKTPGEIYVPENYSDEAVNINRIGTVVVPPKHLFFYRGDNKNAEVNSSRWQTSVEIKKGDTVWFNHMDSMNAYRYTFKGRCFKTIKYDSIIAAKRGEDVIMCNGYVLLSEVKNKTEFQGYSKEDLVQGKGVVSYSGSRNNAYNVPVGQIGSKIIYREDLHHKLKDGDLVEIFKEDYKHVRYLEDENQARFEDRKMFLVVQRYMIAMVNSKPVDDRIIVEPFKSDDFTESGLKIMESAKIRANKGVVVDIGGMVTQLEVGATVTYRKGSGTEVAIGDSDCVMLKEDNLLYIE